MEWFIWVFFDSFLCAIFFLFFFWGYIKYACDWVSALIFQRWNNFGNLLKYLLHFELKDSEIFLFFFVYRIFIFRRKVWRLNRGLRERGFGWTFHDFAENENNGTLKSFIIPFIPSTSSVSFLPSLVRRYFLYILPSECLLTFDSLCNWMDFLYHDSSP